MNHKVTAALFVLFTTSAVAQHAHQGVAETGQSQFAAIAEIVAILREDPNTDWTSVKIDALRTHLVDMNNVTTRSSVEKTTRNRTVIFRLRGDAETLLSAQRMVSAHAPMLAAETGWNVVATATSDGVDLAVTANNQEEVSQIEGLGLFGLMTIGAHHQQHHMIIAIGQSPH